MAGGGWRESCSARYDQKILHAKGLKGESYSETQLSSQQKEKAQWAKQEKSQKNYLKSHSSLGLPLWLLPSNLCHPSHFIVFLYVTFLDFLIFLFLSSSSCRSVSEDFFVVVVFFFQSIHNQPASLHFFTLLHTTGAWKLIPTLIRKTSFWIVIKINPGWGDAINRESWLFTEHLGARSVWK